MTTACNIHDPTGEGGFAFEIYTIGTEHEWGHPLLDLPTTLISSATYIVVYTQYISIRNAIKRNDPLNLDSLETKTH